MLTVYVKVKKVLNSQYIVWVLLEMMQNDLSIDLTNLVVLTFQYKSTKMVFNNKQLPDHKPGSYLYVNQ
jgi:hypothetical protein